MKDIKDITYLRVDHNKYAVHRGLPLSLLSALPVLLFLPDFPLAAFPFGGGPLRPGGPGRPGRPLWPLEGGGSPRPEGRPRPLIIEPPLEGPETMLALCCLTCDFQCVTMSLPSLKLFLQRSQMKEPSLYWNDGRGPVVMGLLIPPRLIITPPRPEKI